VLLTQQSLYKSSIDADLIAQHGFEIGTSRIRHVAAGQHPEELNAAFIRKRLDYCQLHMRVMRDGSANARDNYVDAVSGMFSLGKLSDLSQVSWSELPFADLLYQSSSRSSQSMHVFLDDLILHVQLQYTSTPGSGADKTSDRLAAEGFVRDTLANIVGDELGAAPNAVVNGLSISGTKKNSVGNLFVPVQSWAYARGIALSVNREHGTLSFTRSGTMYVIPVAASRAKRGTEWRSLGGFIVRSDAKHYAPLAGLESLL
jgi:hypothetical protein